jgi:uncharacterized protein YjbJ (UPF0337 family)
MHKNDFEGKWKFIHSHSKVWWGRITDDDLTVVSPKSGVEP